MANDFIPAKESAFYIHFFAWYSKFLTRIRFQNVFIENRYEPGGDSKTIYFLNHSSWWDGLIPLLLNHFVFKQKARALMEDKQMRNHPFFSKIGAFSINLDEPRATIQSLRYALSSLERENSSLFIYPEGEFGDGCEQNIKFKPGLAWLVKRLPFVDIVPVAIHQNNFRHSKSELFISVGKNIDFDNHLEDNKLSLLLEKSLIELLRETKRAARSSDHHFKKF